MLRSMRFALCGAVMGLVLAGCPLTRVAADSGALPIATLPKIVAHRGGTGDAPENTLEAIRSYEFGTGPRSLGCAPAFVRGSAYLKLHDGARAAAEFQRPSWRSRLVHRISLGAAKFGPSLRDCKKSVDFLECADSHSP